MTSRPPGPFCFLLASIAFAAAPITVHAQQIEDPICDFPFFQCNPAVNLTSIDVNTSGAFNGINPFENEGRITIERGATLTNNSGVQLDNDGLIINFGSLSNNGIGVLRNMGTIEDVGSALDNHGFMENDALLADQGTLNNFDAAFFYNIGRMYFNILNNHGFFGNAGTLSSVVGAEFDNYGDLMNFSNSAIDNYTALTNFSGASVTNQGTFNNILGGTLIIQVGAEFFNDDTLNNGVNSTINDNGRLTNSGTFVNQGAFVNPFRGTLTNEAGAELDNFGTMKLGDNSTLNNYGMLANLAPGSPNGGPSGATLINDGTMQNYGILTNFSGATLNNYGTFTNNPFATLDVSGTLTNAGTFTNAGLVVIEKTGSFTTSTNYVQTNGTTLVNGPLITNSGAVVSIQGGTLSGGGDGLIIGSVQNAGGIVHPIPPELNPFAFTIVGDYTQGSAATMLIDLGGTSAGQFSVLGVTNAVSLDGTIDFNAINGFTPSIGDTFTFLYYGTESGHFSNVFSGWSCPVGAHCVDVFGTNSLSLEINAPTPTPEPSSLILFSTGLVALLGGCVLRKRTSARV